MGVPGYEYRTSSSFGTGEMSTHSGDECTSLGFAVLNDFSERRLRKASIKGSNSPSAPRARQDDLDVRMEVLLQSPTTDPNQLSTINTWLLNGLKARQKGGQAESRSDDRLVYELSIPHPGSSWEVRPQRRCEAVVSSSRAPSDAQNRKVQSFWSLDKSKNLSRV